MKWIIGFGLITVVLTSFVSCGQTPGSSNVEKKEEITARALLDSEAKPDKDYLSSILTVLSKLKSDAEIRTKLQFRYDNLLPEITMNELTSLEAAYKEDKKRFSEANLKSVYKDYARYSWGNSTANNLRKIEVSNLQAFAELCSSLKDEIEAKTSFFKEHLGYVKDEELNTKVTNLVNEYYNFSEIIGDFSSGTKDIIPKVDIARKEYRLAELDRKMKEELDEAVHTTWYKPKNAPRYVNSRSFMCYPYIGLSNNDISLRLMVGYFRDDWIFLEHLTFVIDGVDSIIILDRYDEVDSYIGGGVAEWADLLITSKSIEDLDALLLELENKSEDDYLIEDILESGIYDRGKKLMMLKSIANAKKVIVVYKGKKRRTDHTLTSTELQAFKDIMEFFDLLKWDQDRYK